MQSPNVSPMVTDTIRSHIQFGEAAVNGTPNGKPHMNGTPNGKAYVNGTPNGKANGIPNGKAYGNGHVNGNGYSPAVSPTKSMFNGNPSPTPSRGETDAGEHCESIYDCVCLNVSEHG